MGILILLVYFFKKGVRFLELSHARRRNSQSQEALPVIQWLCAGLRFQTQEELTQVIPPKKPQQCVQTHSDKLKPRCDTTPLL